MADEFPADLLETEDVGSDTMGLEVTGEETLLDDVFSPASKKQRLMGDEEDDVDVEAAGDLDENVEDIGDDDLVPPTEDQDEEEDEDVEIVDANGDEEEEEEEQEEEEEEDQQSYDEEEEDDEEDYGTAHTMIGSTGKTIPNNLQMTESKKHENKLIAKELLTKLDDGARSKLCLTVFDMFGEELFNGHEAARDAILIDACARDPILSLMREAVRTKEMYATGTSNAPVELSDEDQDDDDEEEDDEDDENTNEEADDDEEIDLVSEEDQEQQEEQGEEEDDDQEATEEDEEE